MRGTWMTAVLVALLLALPSVAQAQGPPPGNSALDQYQENVPGAGGNQPSSGANGGGGSALSPSAQQALADQGPAGVAAASVAGATAPKKAAKAGGNEGSGSATGTGGSPINNAVDRVVGGGDSGDGMGVALPIILGSSLLGALLLLALRRRGGGEQAH